MNEKLNSFIDASITGDVCKLKYFIDNGFNVNCRDVNGNQAIHLAAIRGFNAVVTILLDTNKVCINSDGYNKYTALHYAIMNKQLSTIELLIEKDADCNAVDINNETPLHFVFKLLANCNHVNNGCVLVKQLNDCVRIRKLYYRQSGKLSFHCVMSAIAEYFIKRGKADLFYLNDDNETPFSLIRDMGASTHDLRVFFEKLFEQCTSLNQIQTSIKLLHLSSTESENDQFDKIDNSLNTKLNALKRRESQTMKNEEIEQLKQKIEYLESNLCCNGCKKHMKTVRFLCGHELCDECYEANDGECRLCE